MKRFPLSVIQVAVALALVPLSGALQKVRAQDGGTLAPPVSPNDMPPPPPPLEPSFGDAPITAPADLPPAPGPEAPPAESLGEAAPEPTPTPTETPEATAQETTPPPASEAPPEPVVAEESSNASVVRADDYDPRIPPHHYVRPQWAVSLNAAMNGLPNFGDHPARAFSFLFEYQPRFVQKIGVLSLGPTVAVYPVSEVNNVKLTTNAWSIWSVGGVARYQARWFRNQWIVPTVGYGYDRITYRTNGASGLTVQKGPIFGLMVLLNALDPDTAATSFVDPGIIRSYLFGEMKRPTGGDTNLQARAEVYQFGLRIEF